MKSRNNPSIKVQQHPTTRGVSFSTQGILPRVAGSLLLVLSLGLMQLQAQCELACKMYAPIALDAQGEVTITEALVLNNYPDPDCPGTILLTVTTMQGGNVGVNIDCAYAGDTLMISATHLGSGNSCWGSIIIQDTLAPLLDCNDVFVACTDTLNPASLGYPDWEENCTSLTDSSFTYTDLYTNLPCNTVVDSMVVTAHVLRTWALEDASGNESSCQQNIWLLTASVDDIEFPADRDGFAAPYLVCGQSVKDLNLTGQPTINGFPLHTLSGCDMIVDSFDVSNPICQGGSYLTVRTWRVIDYCQDTTFYYGQEIHLVDNIPPVIVAPADISIGTSSKTCDAPVILPTSWTASDTCSTFQVNVSWAFGQGYGPFLKIPQGTYDVYYTATDACGNSTTDTMQVAVVDNVKPTAVCKKDVNIALPSSGIITVPASLFDDGSYDNCELDYLEVSRDNKPFAAMATFNCNDIGKEIMVILKAFDMVGLSNTCMMLVQIQDKLPPTIQCPDDITVACTTDIKNLSIIGVAIGTDNCQMKSVTYVDNKFLNQCQSGYVNRVWTAEDIYGNKSGCLQVITQRDTTPISIVWPQNFSSNVCGQDVSPTATGQPIITGWDCENLFVTYVDKEYKTAYPACYRIERCWEIRDWCTFNANQNPNPGFWQFVQYIDIFDLDAPILTIPSDLTIGTTETECYGILNIQSATVLDCNPNTLIINNSPYANSNGASINGIYPVGVHTIMFTAVDGCGNNSMKTMKVTVIDNKPPLAICNNGVSIGLNMNGIAVLPVSLIDNNSRDNCTPFQNLTFSLFPNTFNCDSIGPHEVALTVIDANGNSNLCKTIVVIQDNLGICPSGSKPEIEGMVMSALGVPVSGVEIWLNGSDNVVTKMDGAYKFVDLDAGHNYTISPELDKNPLNGVSVSDLISLQKHVLGQKPLSDPYQLIAGDINNSGHISIADIVEIRKLLLGHQSTFNSVPSWQFVTTDYVFKNPLKPTSEPYPQEILIENIQINQLEKNFIAIKMGDINFTAKTNQFNEVETRQAPIATLWLEDKMLTPGYTYHLPITLTSDEPIMGLQWEITSNEAYAKVSGAQPAEWQTLSEEMMRTTENSLRMVWHEAIANPNANAGVMLYLSITVEQAAKLSDILQLNPDFMAQAVDTYLQEGGVVLRFSEPATLVNSFDVTVWPNPFREQTNVSFTIEEDSPVTLKVYNNLGQILWILEQKYARGSHTVTIPAHPLGRSGTYRLSIETPITRPINRTILLVDE